MTKFLLSLLLLTPRFALAQSSASACYLTSSFTTCYKPVNVASGGTGQTAALTAGGLIYGASTTAMGSTSAGTTSDWALSGGTGTPTFSSTTTTGKAIQGSAAGSSILLSVSDFGGASTAGTPSILLRGSQGTAGSPTQTKSGDTLGVINYRGTNDSPGLTGESASIWAVATQDFTTTAVGSEMRFFTSSNNATSDSQRVTIQNDGNVRITALSTNGPVFTSAGTGLLNSEAQLAVARGGTGLASGTSGGVLGYTASGTLASSAALTAHGVVIGGGAGATPTSTAAGTAGDWLLSGGGSADPSFSSVSTTAKAIVTNTAGVQQSLQVEDFGGTNTAGTPSIMLWGGQGTSASPTATKNNNVLGVVNWRGELSTPDLSGEAASIWAVATQDFTTTIGTELQFYTTLNGGTSDTKRMVIQNDGSVKIANLSTNGPVYTSGGTGLLNSEAQLSVARGGTGIASGTSGGIPYFSGTTTIASSGVLTGNAVVIGGGAGTTPAVVSNNATATNEFLTQSSSGTPAWAALLAADIPSLAASKITSGTLAVAQGGTNLASGTSGGILGFTGTGTLASSVLLTTNALVIGGGAAATPTPLALGSANQILGMNSGATANEYKTLSVGTTGSDFAIANAANSITFNLPDASASNRGAVTTGTQTFAGAKTFNGNTVLGSAAGNGDQTFHGTLTMDISTDSSSTTLTDYSLGHYAVLYLSSGSSKNLTGIIPVGAGQVLWVYNTGGTLTVTNQATSQSANQIDTGSGANLTITGSGGIMMLYINSFWRVLSVVN